MAITDEFPTGHASLYDGTTTINFVFTDGQGKKNERSFKANPYPRTALKTSTGESKYSDLEPPYFAIAQDDWTGGRGNEDFESDTSRYYDGHFADTSKESGVILGGRETYSPVFTQGNREMPGSVAWQALYGTTKYIARSFVASGNYTTYDFKVWMKSVGSPVNVWYELWSDSGGSPNSIIVGSALGLSATVTSKLYGLYRSTALTSGTTYWIVIYGGAGADADDHWLVGCDSTASGKQSSDGSSWSSLSNGLYYHVTPDVGEKNHLFFEYKSGIYFISQNENRTDGQLWINGDRGAADDNSGDKTYLYDSTKSGSWVNDRWIGAKVLITKGPGSEEIQPWRNITDNTTTSLKVSPDWNITHTTSTEYVIIGSDFWTQLDSDVDDHITDVAVAGEFIYMATGGDDGDNGLQRWRFWNKAGVWTAEQEATSTTLISDKLIMINHPNSGETIYSSTTAHEHNDISIYKGKVPRGQISADRYLFHPLHEFNTSVPWKDKVIANTTQSTRGGNTKITIAAAHTTGLAAVLNIDPIDFEAGDTLVAEVKSDVTLAANDYEWVYDDVEDLGKTWSPVKVLKEDYSTTWSPDKVLQADYIDHWQPSKVYHNDLPDSTNTFTDKPKFYNGSSYAGTITMTADDLLYIGSSKKFNKIVVDVDTGTTPNAVDPSTLAAYYHNGQGDAPQVTITDGTNTGTVTLAQDGTISFTPPEDWVAYTINSVDAYWIVLTPSVNLTESVTIGEIYLSRDDAAYLDPSYTDLARLYDGDTNTIDKTTITTDDDLYVGNGTKFNKITVTMSGTDNSVTSTMTAYYWNGSVWTSVTITDGTLDTARTLFKSGDITFTIPNDWEANTVNGIEAYWIRTNVSVNLTADIDIAEITVTADDANAPKTYTDMANAYDGHVATDHDLKLAVADYLYVGNGNKFNKITVDVGTVSTQNAVMTAAYWNGSAWTSVTIVDGTANTTPGSNYYAFEKDGDITFSIPIDWEANTVNGTETYWIRLDISVALTTVFSINEITVTRENNINYDIPAITAGYWTTVFTNTAPSAGFIPDESTIKSIGLNVAVDKGACNFEIRKLWLAKRDVDTAEETVFPMPGGKRINGLQAYAGNVDDPILNPWIFTTDAVYEMQTQNDDQIVEIPLEELGALSSSENGLGHTVNGTYLYFNLGEKIERYFNRTLDDIGPDRDEGLPDDRPGIPKSLASYPGRVYAGIDANTGTSSVLALDGTAWHEIYRAYQTSDRIRSIYIQSIPDTNVDKLWFSKYSDIVSIPISLNPYNETDFTFQHEGHLITSWIYANLLDVVKLWKSLKIFAENVNSNRYIVADYQVDTDTTWTEIGTFNTAPVQERDIASTLPQSKRIRYRLRFITNDEAESPRLKAIVTEGVAFVPVKYQYSWTFAIKKTTQNIDLKGAWDDSLTSVQQYDKLVSWANTGTPLTLRNHSTLYDNKTVFIDPISVSPIRVVNNEGIENHVAALTCIEV